MKKSSAKILAKFNNILVLHEKNEGDIMKLIMENIVLKIENFSFDKVLIILFRPKINELNALLRYILITVIYSQIMKMSHSLKQI